MADFIINIVMGKAFIQFDQVVENGAVLVFSDIKSLLGCMEIKNTNMVKVALPETAGKYSIHVFYGQNEKVKKVTV